MTLFSQVKVAKVRRVIHNVDNWIPYCLATVKLIAKPIMCFRRLTVFAFYLRPQLCSLRLSAWFVSRRCGWNDLLDQQQSALGRSKRR